MATLPVELIDKIFLSNPNKIISTYLAFSKTNEAANADSDKDTNKKRKLNNASKKNITGDKYTIDYLLNNDTYMKYYQKSSWLKYFIPSHADSNHLRKQSNLRNLIKEHKVPLELPQVKLKTKGSLKTSSLSNAPVLGNTNASRVKRQVATSKPHMIIEQIKLIATYFNQLETYYKKQPRSDVDVDGDILALITRFETILDSCDFSFEKYEQQLEALKKYYVNAFEIPAFEIHAFEIPEFVKLFLILYNCGYFAESNNGNSKSGIHIFLEMLLEGDPNKITDFIKTYKYYSAIYKFIPLFNINLGMGYSFVIGWDAEIDSMVGLTENGSDGNEVMYNVQRAMKYFSETLGITRFTKFTRLLKIDKKQLLEDYIKMIGITDISILLDYSRRFDICDILM